MKKIYLQCSDGISGEGIVAALLDLGADVDVLSRGLSAILPRESHVELSVRRDDRGRAIRAQFQVPEVPDRLAAVQVVQLVLSMLTESVGKMVEKICRLLLSTLSELLGCTMEELPFSAMGGYRALGQIVGAALCMESLGADSLTASPVTECMGVERMQPSPMVARLAETVKMPLTLVEGREEKITTIGAAILCGLCREYKTLENARILKMGNGVQRENGTLRAYLLDEEEEEEITCIETNIDDCTGETLGYVMGLLMEQGAKDAFFTPIFMKKNRPACLFTVLCDRDREEAMTRILMEETSTIGVRYRRMKRRMMDRAVKKVRTPYGDILVKECRYEDIRKVTVEYESARAAAKKYGVPLTQVYEVVNAILKENLQG